MRYEERFIGQRLKGANFVYVEARLLDGSRDKKVHEFLLQNSHATVGPLFFFAIALKGFSNKDRALFNQLIEQLNSNLDSLE